MRDKLNAVIVRLYLLVLTGHCSDDVHQLGAGLQAVPGQGGQVPTSHHSVVSPTWRRSWSWSCSSSHPSLPCPLPAAPGLVYSPSTHKYRAVYNIIALPIAVQCCQLLDLDDVPDTQQHLLLPAQARPLSLLLLLHRLCKWTTNLHQVARIGSVSSGSFHIFASFDKFWSEFTVEVDPAIDASPEALEEAVSRRGQVGDPLGGGTLSRWV